MTLTPGTISPDRRPRSGASVLLSARTSRRSAARDEAMVVATAARPLAVPVSAADAAGRVMPPGGIGDCVPEALALAPIGSGGPRPRGRMPNES
jgi:hypothetical protein